MTPIQIDPVGTRRGKMTITNDAGDMSASAVFDCDTGIMHMTQEARNQLWAQGRVIRGDDGLEYLTMERAQ